MCVGFGCGHGLRPEKKHLQPQERCLVRHRNGLVGQGHFENCNYGKLAAPVLCRPLAVTYCKHKIKGWLSCCWVLRDPTPLPMRVAVLGPARLRSILGTFWAGGMLLTRYVCYQTTIWCYTIIPKEYTAHTGRSRSLYVNHTARNFAEHSGRAC